MATWDEFEAAAPDVATAGHALLYRGGQGGALLATVREQEPPRIHPVSVGIIDGRLFAFILPSAKRIDLERDGRYAMHAYVDPDAPSEFAVRGHAEPVVDEAARAGVASRWYFQVDETYRLFEFSIESAVLGLRGVSEWPPRYRTWSGSSRTQGRRHTVG